MGYLPTTNLGISAIRNEVLPSTIGGPTGSMNNIASVAAPYIYAPNSPYKMGSYRGWRLPPATITMTQNDGGIWDGCNYWDVFCYIEGNDATFGQYVDPDFGYIGPYWTPNGALFTTSTERCNTCGTELTFGGGTVTQQVHGRTTVKIVNVMVPQYAAFCSLITLTIWVNGSRVLCVSPNAYDYTVIQYDLYCNPNTSYSVQCNVNYGICK